jgi:AbrB family looped-hinge helix DNA binding protein
VTLKARAAVVTLDQVGRIVIPKPMRVRLGIEADSELEVSLDGTGLRLEPVRKQTRQVKLVSGFPVLNPAGKLVLTDEQIRELRDGDQR